MPAPDESSALIPTPRYRYERWVDPKSNILGSDYATQMILDICGGEASEVVIAGSEPEDERVAYIRPAGLKI